MSKKLRVHYSEREHLVLSPAIAFFVILVRFMYSQLLVTDCIISDGIVCNFRW